MALPEFCEGFHFRYFSADDNGKPKETMASQDSRRAEDLILTRVATILKNRPDVMEQLSCLENALEIHLYQGDGFKDRETELYFIGRVTVGGDDVIMELSTDEVLYGGKVCSEVLDIVGHELTHIIDLLDDMDGELPGWSDKTIRKFEKARALEKKKIRDGDSPLVGYALTNNVEFLAVLAEVFFVRPKALKASNKALFDVMNHFFKLDAKLWAKLDS